MTARAAKRATRRNQPGELAEILIGLREKERRALQEELTEINKRTYYAQRYADVPSDALFTGQILLLGTGTSRDFRWGGFAFDFNGPHERASDVLAARPANIRSGICKAILGNGTRAFWLIVRDLLWRGSVDHPDSEQYYLGMVRSLPAVFGTYQPSREAASEQFAGRLAADPRAVEEFWKALDYEEVINGMSGHYGTSYVDLIVSAVNRGILDRQHLLDVAFSGQIRDLRPSSSGFFRKVVEGLSATTDELASRVPVITRIVGASQPAEQRAAAKTLRRLIQAGVEVDGPALAAAVATPLTGKQKAAAVEALKLLAETPIDVETRNATVLPALGHPHADVQGAALSVLETANGHLSPAVAAEALMWVEAVAPEHRARLQDLVGVGAPTTDEPAPDLTDIETRISRLPGDLATVLQIPQAFAAARAGRVAPPVRLDPIPARGRSPRAVPIRNTVEFAETLVMAIAGSPTGIDIERIIDGFARISPVGVDERVLSPVKKLLSDQTAFRDWVGWDVSTSLGLAAHWWCAAQSPPRLPYLKAKNRLLGRPALAHDLTRPPKEPDGYRLYWAHDGSPYFDGIRGFLSARLWEAVTVGVTAPRPTLTLPSTEDGWLDPEDLASRLRDLHAAGGPGAIRGGAGADPPVQPGE